jgi:hypothetical protein
MITNPIYSIILILVIQIGLGQERESFDRIVWFIILLFPIILSRPSTLLELVCFRIAYSDSLLEFHSTKPPYVVEMVMQNRGPTEAYSYLTEIAIIVFAISLAIS